MKHFRSIDDYKHFSWIIRHNPDALNDERAQEFLHALRLTSNRRTWTLDKGAMVWRAQIGVDERPLKERGFAVGFQPHPPARMKPVPEFAAEGRVSTKGQPCFYCANSKETAMCEVRPWLGSRVSIARFVVNRKLQLIAARPGNGRGEFPTESSSAAETLAHAIWDELGHAFSTPVTRESAALDYAPTQVVATFFKSQGFDGLLYGSLLAPGNNIALFDVDAVDIKSCAVREVKSLQYGFGAAENEYRMSNPENAA